MLTYHSNPLSNPVNPELFYYAEIQHFVYKEPPCADKLWTKIFDYYPRFRKFLSAKILQKPETTK